MITTLAYNPPLSLQPRPRAALNVQLNQSHGHAAEGTRYKILLPVFIDVPTALPAGHVLTAAEEAWLHRALVNATKLVHAGEMIE